MTARDLKPVPSLLGATSTAPRLAPRLRIALFRFQLLAEVLELALAEATIEVDLPGAFGDRELQGELEQARFALFRLSNYVLRRVGGWGEEA